MNQINLRAVDLNLLTIFHAVYKSRRVGVAARNLGMTQPAVSHALNRLRVLFDDPLFVRSRTAMSPTVKAHKLAPDIAENLAGIQQLLTEPEDFDPTRAERVVRIGMLDYGMTLFATRIAEILTRQAPGVTLDFRHVQFQEALEILSRDEIDLAIGPFGQVSTDFQKDILLSDNFVVVARRNHPSIGQRLTVRKFVELGHVRFSNLTVIEGEIDKYFRSRGLTRRVVMTVPHYSSAFFAVSSSDLITTITNGPAELYKDILNLEIFSAPIELPPNRISLVRHRRWSNDPVVDWIAVQIMGLAND